MTISEGDKVRIRRNSAMGQRYVEGVAFIHRIDEVVGGEYRGLVRFMGQSGVQRRRFREEDLV